MTAIAYVRRDVGTPSRTTSVSGSPSTSSPGSNGQDSDYAAAARTLAQRLAQLAVTARRTRSGGITQAATRLLEPAPGWSGDAVEPIWSGDDIDPVRSTAQHPVLTHGQLDDGLLTGRTGIAVALAAASRLPGGQPAWLTLARSAASAAVQAALDQSAGDQSAHDQSLAATGFAGLGWCSGWLGIARGARLVAETTRTMSSPLSAPRPSSGQASEDPLTAAARELAGRAISALEADPMLAPDYPDLLDGLAGHLCAVLAADIPPQLEPARLAAATALLNRLLGWARPAATGTAPVSWPMCGADPAVIGLAHGGSGISMALAAAAIARLPAAVDLTSLIARTRQWEDSHFLAAAGGWPDLRAGVEVPGLAWCHGAPGVGMAAAYRQLAADRAQSREADFRQASAMTRQFVVGATGPVSGSTPIDGTWCHGLGGIVEMHLLAAEAWPEAAAEHLANARLVAQNWTLAGQPGLPTWTCGVRGGRTPNLLTGIAGVAYSLTRCHNPELGPSLAHPGLPDLGHLW